MIHLYYDGSFNGWLNGLNYSLCRGIKPNEFRLSKELNSYLFEEQIEIENDKDIAHKMWGEIKKKTNPAQSREIYVAFLSEDESAIKATFNVVLKIWNEGNKILENFTDKDVMLFTQTVRKVEREKHRMMAFIRFQKTTDGCYHSIIEPDYNVLPIIAKFFKNRYTDQVWLIYDVRRRYGLYYDLINILEIELSRTLENSTLPNTSIELADDEELYNNLWRDYFKNTNIESRRNMKLHIKHVPRRYWKYLIEKQ